MLRLKLLLIVFIAAGPCMAVTVVDQKIGEKLTTENGTFNCTNIGSRNITAYIGWPFHFSCEKQAKDYRSAVLSEYEKKYKFENIFCVVYDNDATLLWNVTEITDDVRQDRVIYPSFDVPEGNISKYRLLLQSPKANYCSYEDISLYHLPFEQNFTCENSSQYIGAIGKSLKVGNVYRMSCELDYNRHPDFYNQNITTTEYIWTHNCSEKLPENALVTDKKLTLTNADFLTGGIYECRARYKGLVRYITRHQICIQHGNAGTYTMNCPIKVKVKLGEDVNITCSVDFGPGEHIWLTPMAEWTKKLSNGSDSDYCKKPTLIGGPRNSTEDERANCDNVQTTNLNRRCFLYNPSPEIKDALKHLVRLTLIIKNMNALDVGVYGLKFSVGITKYANQTIVLEIDEDGDLRRNAYKIGLGIAGLVLLLLLIGFCLWRKMDILWFMKKHFGSYEKERRNFTAYLAYHYSTENMTERSRKLTNDLVGALYKVLEELKATTYDDHKDGEGVQLQIENISRAQKECHRIIIILNPEYVTDHWSLHKAYVAIRNMIEGGTQVIFISLPGVEKYFERIPSEPKTALKHAMKMNTTIKWSGKIPLSGSLRRHLEYALPKCKRQYQNGRDQKMVMGQIAV